MAAMGNFRLDTNMNQARCLRYQEIPEIKMNLQLTHSGSVHVWIDNVDNATGVGV